MKRRTLGVGALATLAVVVWLVLTEGVIWYYHSHQDHKALLPFVARNLNAVLLNDLFDIEVRHKVVESFQDKLNGEWDVKLTDNSLRFASDLVEQRVFGIEYRGAESAAALDALQDAYTRLAETASRAHLELDGRATPFRHAIYPLDLLGLPREMAAIALAKLMRDANVEGFVSVIADAGPLCGSKEGQSYAIVTQLWRTPQELLPERMRDKLKETGYQLPTIVQMEIDSEEELRMLGYDNATGIWIWRPFERMVDPDYEQRNQIRVVAQDGKFVIFTDDGVSEFLRFIRLEKPEIHISTSNLDAFLNVDLISRIGKPINRTNNGQSWSSQVQALCVPSIEQLEKPAFVGQISPIYSERALRVSWWVFGFCLLALAAAYRSWGLKRGTG